MLMPHMIKVIKPPAEAAILIDALYRYDPAELFILYGTYRGYKLFDAQQMIRVGYNHPRRFVCQTNYISGRLGHGGMEYCLHDLRSAC